MRRVAALTPELEGLLAELAVQPERVALGGRVRRFQDLLSPERVQSVAMTGVGALEAHILRIHREELAHLLLQASEVRLAEDDVPVLQPRDEEGRARPVDSDRWRRHARAVEQGRLGAAEPLGAMELLGRALSSEPTARPSARELAIASLRLVPCTAAKIWVGVHYGLEGDYNRGIEMQRSALGDPPTAFLSAYAWSNVAGMSTELRRFQDAVEAGRSASFTSGEFPRGSLEWLVAALQAGHEREAIHAAWVADRCSTPDSECVLEHVSFLKTRRRLGVWKPSREVSDLALRLVGRLPPVAERVLEALL
jgi:hypothetical protein